MLITDRVYGIKEIKEPVLMELITSPEVNRLKKIHQFGMPPEFYPIGGFTRYEHSTGVLLLLRNVGAGLEEQVAGLLHDVSHTAFSHLVDWVYGTEITENHQDDVLLKVVLESSLPRILDKHGFDPETITDHKKFPLLERPAPHLCADRVDYTLREMVLYRNPKEAYLVRDSLKSNGRLLFTSREAAEIFAKNYMACQLEHWTGIEYMIRWRLLAEAIKAAIEEGTITHRDFSTDDFTMLDKLRNSRNPIIQEHLRLLGRRNLTVVIDEENPDYTLTKKWRWVNPEFVESGETHTLTEVDPEYKKEIEKQRRINEKGWKVKIVKD